METRVRIPYGLPRKEQVRGRFRVASRHLRSRNGNEWRWDLPYPGREGPSPPAGCRQFQLSVYAGRDPLSGKDRYVRRAFRGSKRAAQQAVARLVTEVGDGEHVGTDATFAVTTADIDSLYARLRKRGVPGGRPLGPASVRRSHGVVHSALAQAVRWKWLRSTRRRTPLRPASWHPRSSRRHPPTSSGFSSCWPSSMHGSTPTCASPPRPGPAAARSSGCAGRTQTSRGRR